MKQNRYSKQREEIKKFLKSTKTHPTAEEVHKNILKTIPNISLGTVYRNLNFLVETNEIKKIITDNNVIRFDYDTANHAHFTCNNCKKVIDINTKININIEEKENEVETIEINLFGICSECKEKN